MFRKPLSVSVFAVVIGMMSASAHGAVLYDNMPGFPDSIPMVNGYCSSCASYGYQIYQGFELGSNSTIKHTDFAASYISGDINVTIWNSALDTLLFSETLHQSDYDTDFSYSQFEYYVYHADLSPAALSAGSYYISYQSDNFMTIPIWADGQGVIQQTFNPHDVNPSADILQTLEGQHGAFDLTGDASPTPEPASWAMMLGGFGVVGAAMRYRRRQSVAFA